jgi:hypothetical protein
MLIRGLRRISFSLILSATLLSVLPAPAQDFEKCEARLSRSLSWIRHRYRALADFPVWARLEFFLKDADPYKIARLFEIITEEKLKSVHAQMSSGRGQKGPEVRMLIADLMWLNNQSPGIFWSRGETPTEQLADIQGADEEVDTSGLSADELEDLDDDEDSDDVLDADEDGDSEELNDNEDTDDDAGGLLKRIWAALQKAKNEESRRSRTGAFDTHPSVTIQAILDSENVILETASYQPRTQSFWLRRFAQPLYKPVLSLLQIIDYIRDEYRTVHVVDGIVQDLLNRKIELGITDAEEKSLRATLDDTPGQLQDLQVLGARVFGKNVARGTALQRGQVNIYSMAANVDLRDLSSERYASYSTALFDLERVDDLLDAINLRTGRDAYPDQGKANLLLQARIELRGWGLQARNDTYREATSVKPGVSYEDRWTTSSGTGKDRRTVRHTATRYASYENILQDEYYARGTTKGLDLIRRATQKFREEEIHVRGPVLSAQETLGHIVEMAQDQPGRWIPSDRALYTGQVVKVINELEAIQPDLEKYLQRSPSEIAAVWNRDRPEDFRKRNQALLEAHQNARRLARSLLVLLQRNEPLVLADQIPENRDSSLRPTRRQWIRARAAQGTAAGLALVYGIAGVVEPQVFETTGRLFQSSWEMLLKAFGG